MRKIKNSLVAVTLSAATLLSGCTSAAEPLETTKENSEVQTVEETAEADAQEKEQTNTVEETTEADAPEKEQSSPDDESVTDDNNSEDSASDANNSDEESASEATVSEESSNEATSSDEDMYAEILDMYYYQLKNQVVYDDFWITAPVNSMATYAYSKDGYDKAGALDYSGYTFTDLNGDGVNELVIGNLSDDKKLDKMIYTICTVHNNVPYGVLASYEYEKYYICDDNKISKEGGWDEVINERGLYEFAADGLGVDYIEGVKCDKDTKGNATWNRVDADENNTEITEAEAMQAFDEYESKRIQVQLTPFSEYTPHNTQDTYEGMAGTAFGKGYSSWEEGYLAYLNDSAKEQGGDYSYALIYIDDDDVPELVVDTGFEAGGCQILSYYDGTVTVFQTNRLYFTYIEKSGLLCNSEGHMGYYYDNVYALKDGKWKIIFEGNYYEFDENAESDYDEETGRYRTLHYEINGEELDEKTYLERLDEVFDTKRGMPPENYLRIDDLLSYLSTGKMYSEGHRYELIVEDCTWEEADQRCKERGGYLASMTCDEEFEIVDNLIRQQELTNICFFIGANRIGDFWWHWTEPGLANNRCLGNGYWKHWLNGSPSYSETLADGTEIDEDYAEYMYSKKDDAFYINDVPNDVIGYFPIYRGRMGYICEYEE